METRNRAPVTGGAGTISSAYACALACSAANFVATGAQVTVMDRPKATLPAGHGGLVVDLNDLTAAQKQITVARSR